MNSVLYLRAYLKGYPVQGFSESFPRSGWNSPKGTPSLSQEPVRHCLQAQSQDPEMDPRRELPKERQTLDWAQDYDRFLKNSHFGLWSLLGAGVGVEPQPDPFTWASWCLRRLT